MADSQNINPERITSLITLESVRELVAKKIDYKFRYELVGITEKGVRKYIAIYNIPHRREDHVFISSNWTSSGPTAKIFALPSLVKHHEKFGRGLKLSIDITADKIVRQDRQYSLSRSILPDNF